LVEGMMYRREELGPFEVLLAVVIPKPVFTGLEALYSWMSCTTCVIACVLARRTVATSDLAARCTPPEVKPPAIGCETFGATGPAGLGLRVDCLINEHDSLLR
jgi:hypothetical protein